MRTKIEYNNETITFTDGGKIELHCEGKKMASDVVISVGQGSAINGIIKQYKVNAGASVSAGDFVEFVTKWNSGEFSDTTPNYVSACKLDNNRVLIAYSSQTMSYQGNAVILTIEDGEVSIGATKVFNAGYSGYISVAALSNSKVFVAYGGSSYGCARVLTIDGTDISTGEEKKFSSYTASYISATALTDNKVVVVYREQFTNPRLMAEVFTVSGTTITLGGDIIVASAKYYVYVSATALTDSKGLIVWGDNSLSNVSLSSVCRAAVFVVDGTTIAIGGVVTISGEPTRNILATVLTDGKVLVTYTRSTTDAEGTTTAQGFGQVLTINGSTVLKGTETSVGNGSYPTSVKLTENKGIRFYGKYARVFTIDGTDITEGELYTLDTTATSLTNTKAIALSGSSVLLVCCDSGAAKYYFFEITDTTITLVNPEASETQGTFVQPAVSNMYNVGVAKTSGAEGETVEVYCVP